MGGSAGGDEWSNILKKSSTWKWLSNDVTYECFMFYMPFNSPLSKCAFVPTPLQIWNNLSARVPRGTPHSWAFLSTRKSHEKHVVLASTVWCQGILK